MSAKFSESMSPTNLKKFYPYIQGSKKLSILLEKCDSVQQDITETLKSLEQNSCKSKKLVTNLNKIAENQASNERFVTEYQQRKKKFDEERKIAKSQIWQKIDSIITSPKANEKYSLNQLERKELISTPERFIVEYEELKSQEAKDLLLVNKRNFGEYFEKELKIPFKKKKKSIEKPKNLENKTKRSLANRNLVTVMKVKPTHREKGTISQIVLPRLPKKELDIEEKEMLISILNDKQNASERFLVQKYMTNRKYNIR